MPKVKITNNTKAPQGFYERVPDMPEGVDASRAPTFVPPGGSKMLDLTDEHLREAKRLGQHIAIEEVAGDAPEDQRRAGGDDAPDDFDRMTDEELQAFIADRDGKKPHPATGRPKLLANARGATEEAV